MILNFQFYVQVQWNHRVCLTRQSTRPLLRWRPSTISGQALAHGAALRLPCLRQTSFRRSRSAKLTSRLRGSAPRDKLGIVDLPLASSFVNVFNILTGFRYRGLTPRKPFDLETCRRAHVESLETERLEAEMLRAERFTPPDKLGIFDPAAGSGS